VRPCITVSGPANACDFHMHIYDAKYPVAPSATLKPPDALVADYKLLQNRISTTRNVIVTPSTYVEQAAEMEKNG
jgi:D-galactarolactone isomerase